MSTATTEKPFEHRKSPRVTLAEQVEIRDAHTGRVLGQLVNLSVEGLMLVGPAGVAPGTVCQLRVPLDDNGKRTELLIGAESLWCNDANDSGTYWSGFQIIDISPEHRHILVRMVDQASAG